MGYLNVFWHTLILWSSLFWLAAAVRVLHEAAQPWSGVQFFWRRIRKEHFLSTAFGFFLVGIAHLGFGATRIFQYWFGLMSPNVHPVMFVSIGLSATTLVVGEWWLCRVQWHGHPFVWGVYNGGIVSLLVFGLYVTFGG